MKHTQKLKNGFTIVELLIVIVVIGILAALVMNSFSNAQKDARVTKVKSDLSAIKKSMLSYKQIYGELPPAGDFYNAGTNPPGSSWTTVVDLLESQKLMGSDKPVLDPWGFYYGYDDNDCNANNGASYVMSFGPNGARGGGDDISIVVSRGCTES